MYVSLIRVDKVVNTKQTAILFFAIRLNCHNSYIFTWTVYFITMTNRN